MRPFWLEQALQLDSSEPCPPLRGEVRTDVCIVGGGYTGLWTAIMLKQQNPELDVLLIEADICGAGASGRNGGQLIRGIGHEVEGFARHVGAEGVRYLQQAGVDSVELVRRRIEDNAIECDLRWGFCELANTPAQFEAFKAEQDSLAASGYAHETRLVGPEDMRRQVVNSGVYKGGLIDMGSGHLHPLDLVQGEARLAASLGVRIFEQSPVLEIVHGATVQVRCASGTVRAGSLVLGCNAHLDELEQQLSGKVLPAGSYIIATEPLSKERAAELIPQNLALCDQKVGLDYYRLSADRRLLFGGACHYSGRDPKDIAAYMRPKMLEVFPQLAGVKIDYQWSCAMGIVINRIPQLGKLSDNVWYCQGYSGHGIATTHIMGEIMSRAITGQMQQFDTFAACSHIRVPMGDLLGNPMLAAGMWYYQMLEKLR